MFMGVRDRLSTTPFAGTPTFSTYDLVLFAIPFVFLLGVAGAAVTGNSPAAGFKVGGIVAVLPTVYALFGVPPTENIPQSDRAP